MEGVIVAEYYLLEPLVGDSKEKPSSMKYGIDEPINHCLATGLQIVDEFGLHIALLWAREEDSEKSQ